MRRRLSLNGQVWIFVPGISSLHWNRESLAKVTSYLRLKALDSSLILDPLQHKSCYGWSGNPLPIRRRTATAVFAAQQRSLLSDRAAKKHSR